MRYFIITYGCQMNKSDSERIAAVLERTGYGPTLNINEADLILINACSVRQSAIDRIWGKVKIFPDLKNKNKNLKTVLTGCVLKKDRQKFNKSFDLILDLKDLHKLPKILKPFKKLSPQPKNYLAIRPKYQTSFRAYVPVITGCNNFCSYCAVPHTRGKEISRGAGEILREAENSVKNGFKEIWLLGENVNSYRGSPQVDFPELLKSVNNIPGNFWIRFTSPHPKDFSDKLIAAVAQSEKVTKYINLPVQSGDDQILKKMNRPYTVKHYKSLVKKIRKKIKDVCLSTDVIVGFPGETKKQFKNTLKLFKEVKFDMAYIAQYSERAGTAASKLKDNVSHLEKERRERALTKVLKLTALENNKKYIGKTIDILPEERINCFLVGKSSHYKTVKFESEKNLVGRFIKVKIIDALPWGLKGKLT